MKTGGRRSLALAPLLSLVFVAPLCAETNDLHWLSGRVLSASLAGHGSKNVRSKDKNAGKQDIWWTYCISGGRAAYTAVSRTSPVRGGMTVHSPVRFSVDKNRIYVLNSKGERLTLRRVSQDTAKDCP